jgi:cytochrome c oxidase subunit 2
MGGWVIVQSREDFEKWQAGGGGRPLYPGGISATTGDLSLAQHGATLFKKYQCASCHADGPKASSKGGSLVGLYKSLRQLADGSKVVADEGYIRSAILNPNDVRLANSTGSMPAYRGSLSESEVIALIAYIKEIGTGKPLEGGRPDSVAPAANTNSQQWRYMYGGEQYQ